MKELVVVIPAYNPPKRMVSYVGELIKLGFLKIIIVNDGSDEYFQSIFEQVRENKEVIILHNKRNKGKGYSLKKAFSFICKQDNSCIGVITVDADGQHTISDVKRLAKLFLEDATKCILGIRDFSAKQVPFVRKCSNRLTNFIFARLYHRQIHDTQSGFRIFPCFLLPDLCKLEGDRYEYELMVLIDLVKKGREIRECQIATVYHKEKKASSFRPIYDSVQVYKMMWKGKRR